MLSIGSFQRQGEGAPPHQAREGGGGGGLAKCDQRVGFPMYSETIVLLLVDRFDPIHAMFSNAYSTYSSTNYI